MTTKITTEPVDNMIFGFLQGNMSMEEKSYFKKWLNSNLENKAEFKRIYSIWKASSLQSINSADVQKAFERVQLHTFAKNSPINTKKSGQKFTQRILINTRKWAAILIGIIILGPVLYYFFSNSTTFKNSLQAENVISVPLGSKSKIVLPDGTEVWLNAGSKLTYNMNYGSKTREVNLIGEGYFKVTKQKNKPFIVHTVKANIKALGTEFNVKAYPDEGFIETILVKGSVAVNQINTTKQDNSKKESSLILKPGQKARIFKVIETNETKVQIPKTIVAAKSLLVLPKSKSEEITLQNSNTTIETSWKDDRWIIKGEGMDILSVLLARRFNVSISLTNEELLKYKFSGTIQNETLEQVFKIMSLTIPISYTIDKGKVTLSFNTKFEEKYKAAYKN